jgi:transglutaminase-like putative cysteine protease
VTGIGRFGVNLKSTGQGPLIGQRILREPVDAGVLFTPGSPQSIQGPFQHLERDRNGGLYLPGRGDERIRYTIWGRDSERDAVRLRADRTAAPLEPGPGGSRPTTRYLQLPDLDPRVAAQATSIVGSAPTDFERALALRDALRTQGRYTDTPPPLGDEKTSPIEAFLLGEIKGHCEYFASAMVVMARSQGLPARLVNGFAGGIPNEVGGFVEVTRADAHAWVEIHFEQAGWVRFDPTPPALRLRAGDALSLWQRVAQLGSAVELWWFQRVVDFDSADQIGALRSLWRSWRAIREGARDPQQKDWLPASPETELPGLELIPFLLGLVATGVGVFFWRRPRRSPASNVPASYQAAQRILARAGYRRDKTVSARDFVATLSPRLPEDGLAALTIITNHYLAQRFGQAAPVDLSGELSALQDAVDRVRLRNQAHIA